MGDKGPRRRFVITIDHDNNLHSTAFPDGVPKSGKKGDESKEPVPGSSICYDDDTSDWHGDENKERLARITSILSGASGIPDGVSKSGKKGDESKELAAGSSITYDDRSDWYGDESKEGLARTTSIWSGGWDSFTSRFAEFTYIALQGKDSICVVTGDDTLVKNSRNHCWMASVITCIKADYVFGYDQRERGLYLGMPQEDEDLTPFATVNVVMSTNLESGDEASSVGLNEKEAIALLMKKMEKGWVLSYEETIQVALSALQHLLKRRLYSDTVKVCVEKKGMEKAQQLTSKEINPHLKVINKPRKASRTAQPPRRRISGV